MYYQLTDDWRCQDVFRKVTGIAVKLLHEGKNKAKVEEGLYAALASMCYRTAWPTAELPPNLQQWLGQETRDMRNRNTAQKMVPSTWKVNVKGELIQPPVTIQVLNGRQEILSAPDYCLNLVLNEMPDNRITLLCNPHVTIDKKGKLNVKFFNNDKSKKVKVLIQGLDENGRFIYRE